MSLGSGIFAPGPGSYSLPHVELLYSTSDPAWSRDATNHCRWESLMETRYRSKPFENVVNYRGRWSIRRVHAAHAACGGPPATRSKLPIRLVAGRHHALAAAADQAEYLQPALERLELDLRRRLLGEQVLVLIGTVLTGGASDAACGAPVATSSTRRLPWPAACRAGGGAPANSSAGSLARPPSCGARRTRAAPRAAMPCWRRRPAPSDTPCGGALRDAGDMPLSPEHFVARPLAAR